MGWQDEAGAWIALRGADGVGDVVGRRLIAHFLAPRAVLAADADQLAAAGFTAATAAALTAALAAAPRDASAAEAARLGDLGGRLIPFTDAEYPSLLRHLADAPLYLTARGEPLVDTAAIAVVGARHASRYGRQTADRIAGELAQAGITVVSGLARGIDGAAHEGTLRVGGYTIAVFGTGIDVIYPREHAALAERIVARGTVLSERPLGAPPLAGHFPARNRIIAGMTHGTVVVEAAERSGSLITAQLALDNGREVFAVPGSVDSPLSVGTHRLIKQGAKLTTSADDVIDEIKPVLRSRAVQTKRDDGTLAARPAPEIVADPSSERLLALLVGGPLAVDELIRESGLPASSVLARVLELELRGALVQLPGRLLQLAAR